MPSSVSERNVALHSRIQLMKRILSYTPLFVLIALVISVFDITPLVATYAATYIAPRAGSSITESVSKSGVADTKPNDGIGSQTIQWTIDYDLSSAAPLSGITLSDTWSTGQTLITNSVHTPGGTWSFNQQDGTTLIFSNTLVAPNGKGAGIPLSIPLSGPISFSGGGDGYNPALTANGKLLGINHHTSSAGIWCYDLIANAVCSGYKVFPGINTTTGSVVRAIGNKIYIMGSDTASGSNGQPGNIYCWDTDTDSLCGVSPHIDDDYDRLVVASGKLYTLLSTGEVDCFDASAELARCSGYPIQINVPASTGNLGNGLLPVGDSLYALNWLGNLNCLNLANQGFCEGWSSTPLTAMIGEDILFPRLDADGTITGICQIGAGTPADCYDLDGTNPTNITDMAELTSGTYSFANEGDYYGSRVYFAGFQNNVTCWDWATSAACTGSGFDSNGRVTAALGLPYGITHDSGCLYTFGDGGSLFSLDPFSGETPCARSTGQVTVNIDDFYNATPGTVSAGWDKVSLSDIDLTAGVEFNSLIVEVINPSDSSVITGPTEMISSTGVIDLSSVSTATRSLKLQVVAQPVGTTAWADQIGPKIWLTFDSGTPVQFSYQTMITCAGNSQSHTNTITTILDPHSDQATLNDLCADATPTATPTSTPTDTPTATSTSTPTPTETPTSTPTDTSTPTPTSTSTATSTSTPTATATETSTSTPTETQTPTPTSTPAATSTPVNQLVQQKFTAASSTTVSDTTYPTLSTNGVLTMRLQVTNISTPLNNVVFRVSKLPNGYLLNADGSPGQVGSQLTVSDSALPGSNQVWDTNELLVQDFRIGLMTRAGFAFQVDVYANKISAQKPIGRRPNNVADQVFVGSFTVVVDPNAPIVYDTIIYVPLMLVKE